MKKNNLENNQNREPYREPFPEKTREDTIYNLLNDIESLELIIPDPKTGLLQSETIPGTFFKSLTLEEMNHFIDRKEEAEKERTLIVHSYPKSSYFTHADIVSTVIGVVCIAFNFRGYHRVIKEKFYNIFLRINGNCNRDIQSISGRLASLTTTADDEIVDDDIPSGSNDNESALELAPNETRRGSEEETPQYPISNPSHCHERLLCNEGSEFIIYQFNLSQNRNRETYNQMMHSIPNCALTLFLNDILLRSPNNSLEISIGNLHQVVENFISFTANDVAGIINNTSNYLPEISNDQFLECAYLNVRDKFTKTYKYYSNLNFLLYYHEDNLQLLLHNSENAHNLQLSLQNSENAHNLQLSLQNSENDLLNPAATENNNSVRITKAVFENLKNGTFQRLFTHEHQKSSVCQLLHTIASCGAENEMPAADGLGSTVTERAPTTPCLASSSSSSSRQTALPS